MYYPNCVEPPLLVGFVRRSGRRLRRRREALREVVGQLIEAGDLVGGSRPGGVDVVAGPDEADGVDIGLPGSADVAGGGGDVGEGGTGDRVGRVV